MTPRRTRKAGLLSDDRKIELLSDEAGSLWTRERLREPWDDWAVNVRHVRNAQGQAIPAEVHIEPAEPLPAGPLAGAQLRPGGLSRAVFSQVRLSAHSMLAAEAAGRMARNVGRHLKGWPGMSAAGAAVFEAFAGWPVTPRPWDRKSKAGRPRKWTDLHLIDAAIAYDEACHSGESAVKAVRSRFREKTKGPRLHGLVTNERHRVTERTANGIIKAARKAGYLPLRGRGASPIFMTRENREALILKRDELKREIADSPYKATVA